MLKSKNSFLAANGQGGYIVKKCSDTYMQLKDYMHLLQTKKAVLGIAVAGQPVLVDAVIDEESQVKIEQRINDIIDWRKRHITGHSQLTGVLC